MRKLLFLLLMLGSFAGFCGEKTIHLFGKWKETKRMKPDKTEIKYTDTIRLQFLVGNEYVYQKQGGFIYKGVYKVTGNDLDMGARGYTILERKPNKMVLQDDGGIYTFEPDNTPTTAASQLPQEKPAAPVTSVDQMVGHWSVYKRTSDKTLNQVDYTHVLKMVDITGGSSDGKLGYLYATRDADNAPSWYATSYQNQTLYCDGKDKREFKVLKCQDNELIMEENGITYFFKRFK
ncbi:MAG: hypothetical protein ACTHJ0_05795 [Flavipsychrobacter sp.]